MSTWSHKLKHTSPRVLNTLMGNVGGSRESWPCGPKCGRAIPDIHQLQHSIEPTLLAQVWVSQPRNGDHRRVVPITYLSCGGMHERKLPSSPNPHPSMPEMGGRDGPVVIRMAESSLTSISWAVSPPHQGSTTEPTWLAQMSQPRNYDHGRAVHISHLPD